MDAPFPAQMMPCIEEFFESIHSYLVPGQDIYPEVFSSSLFFPLQRQKEMVWMQRRAREYKPKVIMEIGADKGGSLYHWCMCQYSTVEVVIACEIRGTPYARLFEDAFPQIRFLWLEESSNNYLAPRKVSALLGEVGKQGIDCLFIDGDKGAFLTDFNCYLPLMSKPSTVFMHDINGKELTTTTTPEGAFRHLRQTGYNFRSYVDITDVTPALMGEEKGIPPENPHEGWLRYWKGNSCGVGQIEIE